LVHLPVTGLAINYKGELRVSQGLAYMGDICGIHMFSIENHARTTTRVCGGAYKVAVAAVPRLDRHRQSSGAY
jgi:hypothetical protein